MIHRLVWSLAGLLALTLGDTAQLTAQVQLASRAPRFVRISPVTRRLVDASHATILKREMSLSFDRSSLADALDEISRTAGINLIYSRDLLPLDTPVTLQAATISLGAALTAVLFDTGLDVVISSNGEMALMKKAPISPLARAPTGSVGGRVTDVKTAAVIAGATVVIERTSLSATTDNDGRYRIAEVTPGTYTVRARYIGYAPGTVSVTVSADQEATADFVLEKSLQKLDELVTTGTLVPTEVKALPTPVSVISERDIALQRPHTVQDVLRQAVPTMVSWDIASDPQQTLLSVRGSSNFTAGLAQMKVLVDGVEAANASYTAVDPNSIERIEVVRGPQAAAIYGSEAIGGVVQIFTKRGNPGLARPQVNAEAALGLMQTPYAGYNGVLRQQYTASVRGAASDLSYNVGGGYSHTGNYLPNGEISDQSNPSVYGGMHFAQGIVSADVSGRYHAWDYGNVANPAVNQTGFVRLSKPFYQPFTNENVTIGARFGVAPAAWWQSALTVGLDRRSQDATQAQRRLTTPVDTLFSVSQNTQLKRSIGFSTSIQGSSASHLSGALTLGFDHWSLPVTQFFTEGALNTTGTILVAPGQSVTAIRTITTNTGYFAQGQVGFREVLFLTAGLRAEQNSNFGDELGTPLSPRLGLSYVQPLGGTTFKVRGSWGKAIRAPSPGLKLPVVSASSVILANPDLAPERQRGWDAGAEAVFGSRALLSVTYFNQTADDLIQQVLLPGSSVPTRQAQNVGRVKNTGVEVEGTLYMGWLQIKGQYGYTRSRVDQLAPGYAGELRVGDQSQFVPKHTAGASAMFAPFGGMTMSTGFTYVGSWEATDLLAFYSCLGSTGPCRPTFRDYTTRYPGFVKVNLGVTQQITPIASGFISIDNLTNNEAFEYWNLKPVTGRIATAGLRLQY